jgi:hypothetical protein
MSVPIGHPYRAPESRKHIVQPYFKLKAWTMLVKKLCRLWLNQYLGAVDWQLSHFSFVPKNLNGLFRSVIYFRYVLLSEPILALTKKLAVSAYLQFNRRVRITGGERIDVG